MFRRRRLNSKPAFPLRNNSYRDVILAFDDTAAAGTPPMPSTTSSSSVELELGCSNPVTSGPLAESSECWWQAGAWPAAANTRKPLTQTTSLGGGGGLMPIDERLEDLYAAAKQQQRWRDSQKNNKVYKGSKG